MKIVQLEPIGMGNTQQSEFQKKLNEKGHELILYNDKPSSTDTSIERAAEADLLIISNMPLGKEILSSCQNLKMISVAFAGVDHIDMDYCRENNILVANAADYSTHSVAELTFSLILSLYRKLRWSEDQLRKGNDRQGFLGSELYGKTLGIVGLGRIGTKVAELGRVFGCKILTYNRTPKNREGTEQTSLEDLLKHSDIVSIHVPLTKDTKGMIGVDEIQRMKSASVLINTARGPVVDSEALANALNNEKIAGAGIDVYEKDPPINKEHPLLKAKNAIVLPHIGFATKEAIDKRSRIVMENITGWLNNKPKNVVS